MHRSILPWTRPRPRGRLHVMSYRHPSAPIAGARARADGRDRPDGLPLAGRSHARPVACEAPRKKPPQDEEEEGGGEGQAADRARLGRRWAPPRPSNKKPQSVGVFSAAALDPLLILMRGAATSPPAPRPRGMTTRRHQEQEPCRRGRRTARWQGTRQLGARTGGRDRPARLPPSGRSRVKAPRLEMRRASNHCKKKMMKWAVEKSKRQAADWDAVGSNSGRRRDSATVLAGRRRPSPPLSAQGLRSCRPPRPWGWG